MGVPGERVTTMEEFNSSMKPALSLKGLYLIKTMLV